MYHAVCNFTKHAGDTLHFSNEKIKNLNKILNFVYEKTFVCSREPTGDWTERA